MISGGEQSIGGSRVQPQSGNPLNTILHRSSWHSHDGWLYYVAQLVISVPECVNCRLFLKAKAIRFPVGFLFHFDFYFNTQVDILPKFIPIVFNKVRVVVLSTYIIHIKYIISCFTRV
jgi:hypothetical protein